MTDRAADALDFYHYYFLDIHYNLLWLYFMYSTKYYLNNQNKDFIFAWTKFMESISKLKMLRTFFLPRRFDLLDLCRIYDSNCATMTQKLLQENVGFSWFFEKLFLKSTPKSELYLFAIFKIWLVSMSHELSAVGWLGCPRGSWACLFVS